MKLVNPEEAAMPRVYIAGPIEDICGYDKAVAVLHEKGFSIANTFDAEPVDTNHLRRSIATLTTCNAICMLDDWWTSTEAHCLLQVAGWLRLQVVDPHEAKELETISVKGARR